MRKTIAQFVIAAALFVAGGVTHSLLGWEHSSDKIEVTEVADACVRVKSDNICEYDIREYDAVVFEAIPAEIQMISENERYTNFVTVTPIYKVDGII